MILMIVRDSGMFYVGVKMCMIMIKFVIVNNLKIC